MDAAAQPAIQTATGHPALFLVGLPGVLKDTVRQLLASTTEIQAAHEDPWFLLPLLYQRRETGHEAEYNQTTARIRCAQFLSSIPGGEARYTEGLRRFATDLYQARLGAGQRYVLDASDRYYHIVPELKALLPEARIIFIVGNPLDPLRVILQDKFRGYFPALYQHDDIYRDLYTGPKALAASLQNLDHLSFVLNEAEIDDDKIGDALLARLSEWLGLSAPIKSQTWKELRENAKHVTAAGLPPLPQQPIDSKYVEAASQYLNYLGDKTLTALGYPRDQLQRYLLSEYLRPIANAFVGRLPTDVIEPLFGCAAALSSQLQEAMLADHAAILAQGEQVAVPETLRREIAEAIVWLGEQRFDEGDERGALDTFELATELDPACTRAYSNQAVILHQRGATKAALELLFKGHNTNPGDITTLANLCALLKETGKISEAQQLAIRFLAENPDNDEALQLFIDMN